jgi:hypothetical protein
MTAHAEEGIWKHCNICKKPIAFGAGYLVCSVSTCNRKRTGLIFCSLPCFDAHLPTARHRDAWAEQEKAPSEGEWQATLASEAAAAAPRPAEQRAAAPGPTGVEAAGPTGTADEHEVLVVVSKLKKYVRDWSGMNTSDGAMAILSDHLRELCREATRQAGMDSRRTVLDRDFAKVLAERRAVEVKRRF